MPQPSIRSLARQLGLSAATVSLALRDSPRVMAATKRRVRQAAGRAGYQPNPLVRSVMAAMRRSAHDSFQGALMALNYTEEAVPVLNPSHGRCLPGRSSARANWATAWSCVGRGRSRFRLRGSMSFCGRATFMASSC